MTFDMTAMIAIAIIALLAGGCGGAVVMAWTMTITRQRIERGEKRAGGSVDPRRAKWMRTGERVQYGALRAMRRRYPTSDIVTNVPLLSIVQPMGAAAVALRVQCKTWTLAMALVDKRTGELLKIALRSDEDDLAEKQWVLRQTGVKTTVVEADADETAIDQAMAA